MQTMSNGDTVHALVIDSTAIHSEDGQSTELDRHGWLIITTKSSRNGQQHTDTVMVSPGGVKALAQLLGQYHFAD